MFVNFNILNQLGSPAINSNTFANRPAAGQTGRLFVSTDTFEIYRDNGTTWDLIGGPGSSTITGTGTATQVAYFTSSQAIGSSANLYWDNTAGALGINTATPGAKLDVHGTGTIAQFNTTAATGNVFLAIQRSGTGLWRIGDTYNSGSNYFELHNTTLASNAIQIAAATNKSILTSLETYSTGVARGNYLDYTLSLANGTTFTSPNTVTALGATLNLNIAGSATIPAGARSGADFFNGINFTSAGTFTVNQASTIRAFSNVTAGWAFNGSAVGTVTHLAGLRVLFPTNSGSAINVTDNYALLINNQNANTGTINYTNRWGIYQEGSSDLNYFAANTLIGTTTNSGQKLVVNGATRFFQSTGITTIIESDWDRSLTNDTQLYIRGNTNTNKQLRIGFDTTANQGYIQALNSGIGTNDILINPSGGNLGLGVTPSAWGFITPLQIKNSTFAGYTTGTTHITYTASNWYLNGSGADTYIANGAATLYSQASGQHAWYNAPSGTAGNAISFTQAMTLDASGNLMVGGTSSTGYWPANLTQNAARQIIQYNDSTTNLDNAYAGLVILNSNTTASTSSKLVFGAYNIDPIGVSLAYISAFNNTRTSGYLTGNLVFGTSNGGGAGAVERFRTTAGGNLLIGTTIDAGYKLFVNGISAADSGFLINNGQYNTLADVPYIGMYATSASSPDLFGALLITSRTDAARPIVFGISNGTNSVEKLRITTGGNLESQGSIKTAAPNTGTAANWKLGSRVAATVALDTTQYIELDVGGTLYKLAIVT